MFKRLAKIRWGGQICAFWRIQAMMQTVQFIIDLLPHSWNLVEMKVG